MADVRLRDLNPAEFNYGVNIAGSLGVGTTSPSDLLTVGDGTSSVSITINKSDAGTAALEFESAGTDKCYVRCNASEDLILGTGDSDRVSILSGGNVGLGTGSSVSTKLHVRGNSDTSDHDCAIRIVDADGTAGSIIPNLQFWTDSQQIYQIRANDTMGLQFRKADDVTVVTFDENGRVGIGETNPSNELHVSGTSTVLQLQSSTSAVYMQLNTSGGNATFVGANDDDMVFWTDSTQRMRIYNNGLVTIGDISSAACKLHVEYGVAGTSTVEVARVLKGAINGGGEITLGTNVPIGGIEANNDVASGGSLRFSTLTSGGSRTEKVRITNDGKVGINTTSPEETLHVNGNLKVTGTVDVGSSGFSVSSGFILSFGGGTAPSGWLECNGQAVSRSTYSDLFAIVGTIYGAGDGSTTFNVPDLQGRVIIGEGGNTAGRTPADLESIGDTGGSQTANLVLDNLPSHSHNTFAPGSTVVGFGPTYSPCENQNGQRFLFDRGGRSGRGCKGGKGWLGVNTTTNKTGTTGAGTGHNNIQPSTVVMYLIKT